MRRQLLTPPQHAIIYFVDYVRQRISSTPYTGTAGGGRLSRCVFISLSGLALGARTEKLQPRDSINSEQCSIYYEKVGQVYRNLILLLLREISR